MLRLASQTTSTTGKDMNQSGPGVSIHLRWGDTGYVGEKDAIKYFKKLVEAFEKIEKSKFITVQGKEFTVHIKVKHCMTK
jgi:hypothetical protein